MGKFRITFDVDTTAMLPEATLVGIEEFVTRALIRSARARQKQTFDAAKASDLPDGDKAAAMAQPMRDMMLTLMAEANLRVETLPDDAYVEMELPFEKRGGE